ncbi:MAG: ribbon-helix-helix domain-containing protein [Methanobacteriota archaeon]
MQPTERVTLRLPTMEVVGLDALIRLGLYPSRSEAIRQAIKILVAQKTDEAMKEHERRQKLMELQAAADAHDQLIRK